MLRHSAAGAGVAAVAAVTGSGALQLVRHSATGSDFPGATPGYRSVRLTTPSSSAILTAGIVTVLTDDGGLVLTTVGGDTLVANNDTVLSTSATVTTTGTTVEVT
jgi:hypothetical protein